MQDGVASRQVAQWPAVSHSDVVRLRQQHEDTGIEHERQRSGGSTVTTPWMDRFIWSQAEQHNVNCKLQQRSPTCHHRRCCKRSNGSKLPYTRLTGTQDVQPSYQLRLITSKLLAEAGAPNKGGGLVNNPTRSCSQVPLLPRRC